MADQSGELVSWDSVRATAFAQLPNPTILTTTTGDGDIAAASIGQIADASMSFQSLVGEDLGDVVGRPLRDYIHPDDHSLIDRNLLSLLDPAAELHVRVIGGWGIVWVSMATSIVSVEGQAPWILLTLTDISESRKNAAELARRATHDPLTGLPNRGVLLEHLAKVLASMHRKPGAVAVMFLDLDGFKQINDSFGHDVGDDVLIEFSRRIRVAVRQHDLVGRLGGDEFVVVCDALSNQSESVIVADRIRQSLESPIVTHDQQLRVGVSIGVAQTSDSTTAADDLLRRADLAMYAAKERGRNHIEFFASELEEAAKRRWDVVDEMRTSLEQGQSRLMLQPVVSLSGLAMVGRSAELEVATPDGTFVVPRQRLTAQMRTGLLEQTDSAMLRVAMDWLAADDGGDSWLSVHLSARKMLEPKFAQSLLAHLESQSIDPSRLMVLVGENGISDLIPQLKRPLRELTRATVKTGLAEFGASYGALAALRRLPCNYVRIEPPFVAELGTDDGDDAIVRAILTVAADLGLEAIARGIETPQQAEFLSQNGCSLGQGPWFGVPEPMQPKP